MSDPFLTSFPKNIQLIRYISIEDKNYFSFGDFSFSVRYLMKEETA